MNRGSRHTCYICGSGRRRALPGKVRDCSRLKVFECAACGLVYLSDTSHIHGTFYADSRMHGEGPSAPSVDAWLRETECDDERRFRFYESSLRSKALLDFGCGAGGFLLKARRVCSLACGIEPEQRLQSHYGEQNLSVYPDLKALEAERSRTMQFDVVSLFHVLEHLPDPRRTLRELSRRLAPRGRIVVEVPHAHDALLSLYQNKPFSRFTYWSCHLFLFTAPTLGKLAEQAGMKVDYIKQVQRYPLSNHLYWLARGRPGGHSVWGFLDSAMLHDAYEKQLASIGCCDTLAACFQKGDR
ncbi:MAG TPA: class I SAM-dependent methyltransferase [Candidatus Omnitrophota bacterium]|nr:class I SAM-dependent methyltransferase [Candidatus Omnitrophota bacterium]HNQ50915.1 class I SAM-dependent methyltransferase [Candidatus Omnitrophota bacterium]